MNSVCFDVKKFVGNPFPTYLETQISNIFPLVPYWLSKQ